MLFAPNTAPRSTHSLTAQSVTTWASSSSTSFSSHYIYTIPIVKYFLFARSFVTWHRVARSHIYILLIWFFSRFSICSSHSRLHDLIWFEYKTVATLFVLRGFALLLFFDCHSLFLRLNPAHRLHRFRIVCGLQALGVFLSVFCVLHTLPNAPNHCYAFAIRLCGRFRFVFFIPSAPHRGVFVRHLIHSIRWGLVRWHPQFIRLGKYQSSYEF